jgi:hypothetical protein
MMMTMMMQVQFQSIQSLMHASWLGAARDDDDHDDASSISINSISHARLLAGSSQG